MPKKTMKPIHLRIVMLLTILTLPASTFGRDAATHWQTARVCSTELNGHGPNPSSTAKGSQRRDIWWTYCISSGEWTYTAVIRESPARSGMKIGNIVRMSVQKDRMQVLDNQGKRHVLRVIRQVKGAACR